VEGSGGGLILRHYPRIWLKGLRKTTKTLSQDSRAPDRDLNPGPPVHEAVVLTTRPRRSVLIVVSRAIIALNMEALSTPETVVNFYHTTRHIIPEDTHLYNRRLENLNSHSEG
jgi:hypothetical protein